MSKKEPCRVAAALRAKGPPRRSALFKYLLTHYDELAPLLNRKTPSWRDAAAEVAADGIAGANGKPPTANALRQVWLRVARDAQLAQAENAKAPHKKVALRSRPRADWQPPLADVPRTASALQYRRGEPEEALPPRRTDLSPPSQAPPASSKPKTIADLSPEGRAKIERLKRILQEDDRKKFGHL